MNGDNNFYLKISLLLAAAFGVWIFGAGKKISGNENASSSVSASTSPAALSDFAPPALKIFKEPESDFPKRNWSAPFLELKAEAALAMSLDGGRIYYNKNIETRRPIASLTKLMTAIIVLENYDLNRTVKISAEAVKRESASGGLRVGENIAVRSLLSIMLIDSSNDAAFALAEQKKNFISLMNEKAVEMGLKNTHFSVPDGLDSDGNYSSALDIAKIFVYLVEKHSEALEILKTKNMTVYSVDGKIEHRLESTDKLLDADGDIIAGKTGFTDNAGGCLVLLAKNGIVSVVLGSTDRFGESQKMIQWLKTAYIWK